MNLKNYKKWVQEKLFPNLKNNSVLVIDNAPCHNVQLNPAPTSSSLKKDKIKWLTDKNISHSSVMLKPELYNIIKTNKLSIKSYKILQEASNLILRLPPYHLNLNPIELIWATVKEYITKEKYKIFNKKY
uniref:Tc1-like transposase DDE domain-containing protein n=1 Tax=Graphocephala atropunctata TaxID=36148 RepID=A0A1B6M0C1_9HEMI